MVSDSSRDDVLKSLGVRSWFCKYTLPYAAETPSKIYDGVKSLPAESTGLQLEVTSNASNKIVPLELLTSISPTLTSSPGPSVKDVSVGSEQSSAVENVLPTESQSRHQIVGVSLSIVFYDKAIVIYELPETGDGQQEKSLLDNVISAFLGGKQKGEYRFSSLYWPVFKSKALLKDQSLYFESVSKRWLSMCQLESSYVLYFGENFKNVELILKDVQASKEIKNRLIHCQDALGRILGSEMKKKNLWSMLSGLRDDSD